MVKTFAVNAIKKRTLFLMCLLFALFGAHGCVSVAGYQRMYLEDPDMQLNSRSSEAFELEMQSYREGTAGANGGKSGGGCGCN